MRGYWADDCNRINKQVLSEFVSLRVKSSIVAREVTLISVAGRAERYVQGSVVQYSTVRSMRSIFYVCYNSYHYLLLFLSTESHWKNLVRNNTTIFLYLLLYKAIHPLQHILRSLFSVFLLLLLLLSFIYVYRVDGTLKNCKLGGLPYPVKSRLFSQGKIRKLNYGFACHQPIHYATLR